MLKKLMSFLFEEEEEEVYADEELEEAIFKDVPRKNVSQDTPVMPLNEPVRASAPIQQPKPSRPIQQTPPPIKEEPRKFTSIDLEPKKEKVEVQPVTRHRSIMADGPAPVRTEKTKPDFAFSPIISPIFGSNDDVASPSPTIPTATGGIKKKSGGVISPMYGMEEQGTETSKIPPKRRHAVPIADEIAPPIKPEIEEFPDLPLEAIIKNEEDIEDDSMQISLFGEDAPIRDSIVKDLKIEE